jgi:hypothetical protein
MYAGADRLDVTPCRPVSTPAKLKAARDRKIAAGEKCGGRKSYAEARPKMLEPSYVVAGHTTLNDQRRRSFRGVHTLLSFMSFRS